MLGLALTETDPQAAAMVSNGIIKPAQGSAPAELLRDGQAALPVKNLRRMSSP